MNGYLVTVLMGVMNALFGVVIWLLSARLKGSEDEIKSLRSRVHLLQVDVRELLTKQDMSEQKVRRK